MTALAMNVRYSQPAGRWVLTATVLGSALAFVDATVVNVALPRIGAELNADLAGLQWTVNGYTLTLAAFILLGGSLGDRYGRRKVFLIGIGWFAAASLLCGIAPNVTMLVLARALQGIGGALLTPGSLAILQASFHPDDRARAIGAWSGLGGIAGAFGPLLGGWLVEIGSWRLVFLINIPLAVAVMLITARHVPESADPDAAHKALDVSGAVFGSVGLAGLTYGLTEWPERGGGDPLVAATLVVGVLGLVGFVLAERRSTHPMLPLDVFVSRQFTAANLVTFLVYGAIGVVFFLLVITLQVVAGFSPVASGVALLPVTVLMLLLSARAGALAQRIGPRIPMSLGPVGCAVGLLLLIRIGPGASYPVDVLPAVIIFGLGLSLTVAPLTATVLAAAEDRHAGVASGVNNAVARVAGLLAVAAIPLVTGLSGDRYADPGLLSGAFRTSMVISAALLLAGGVLAYATIRSTVLNEPPPGAPDDVAEPREQSPCRMHCAVGAPPLHPAPAGSGAPSR